MYIGSQTITYIIGGLMLAMLLIPLILKQYYISKTKGKTLVRVVNANEEETRYLLKIEGSTTEPNPKGRAYAVRGKKTNPATKETSGSTYETWYPEGMPHFLQVRVRAMSCVEGNPNAINFYGSQEALNITDKEIGTIKKEKFSEVAVEVSKDYKDLLKDIKSYIKPGLSRAVVYIMLGVAIVGILAVAYLSYRNSQAISDLGRMWGW